MGMPGSEKASTLQFASFQREDADQFGKARGQVENKHHTYCAVKFPRAKAKRSFQKVEQYTCEYKG